MFGDPHRANVELRNGRRCDPKRGWQGPTLFPGRLDTWSSRGDGSPFFSAVKLLLLPFFSQCVSVSEWDRERERGFLRFLRPLMSLVPFVPPLLLFSFITGTLFFGQECPPSNTVISTNAKGFSWFWIAFSYFPIVYSGHFLTCSKISNTSQR